MIGIELVENREHKTRFDLSDQVGRRICIRALEHGVWIRPLGDVIVLMPPLVASDSELDHLADAVLESIRMELSCNDSSTHSLNVTTTR